VPFARRRKKRPKTENTEGTKSTEIAGKCEHCGEAATAKAAARLAHSKLTGEAVEDAARAVKAREEFFFGAEFPGVRDEAAP
jgi:hypothetical protein